jgi:hypothetical protein
MHDNAFHEVFSTEFFIQKFSNFVVLGKGSSINSDFGSKSSACLMSFSKKLAVVKFDMSIKLHTNGFN